MREKRNFLAELTLCLKHEEKTRQLASFLADQAQKGDTVLLRGPLGAGKSVFCRSFIRSFCQNPSLEVPSPSYTLVQEYVASRGHLTHFDLWRLSSVEEIYELGWDEMRMGIVLVEWPERLEHLIPSDALHIELAFGQTSEQRYCNLAGWEGRIEGLKAHYE